MTEQLTRCPHCKGSGYLELRSRRMTPERKARLMNAGGFLFALGGFLGSMALGAGFWMVFLFGVLGMMIGARLSE